MVTRPRPSSPAELDSEQREMVRNELERILASPAFRRSERHARFLRFVCESTLNGEAGQLNEYLIAHRVFDRCDDYSPGEDSVVRRQAYSLRQKLQEYYAGEGAKDTVRIELPVGRYVPSFRFVETVETEPETTGAEAATKALPAPTLPVAPSEPTLGKHQPLWLLLLAALSLSAVCGLAGWWAGHRSNALPPLDPVYAQVWGPLLTDGSGGVICFSNALTAGVRQIEQRFPDDVPTRGIELNSSQAQEIRSRFRLPDGGFFYINPTMAHAKMGEALGGIQLATLFSRAGVPVRATQSRYLNWQDFRNQNLVLLGHGEANPWLDPILSKLPYGHAKTTPDKPRRIVVHAPTNGERAEYYPNYAMGKSPAAEDYALVSFIPSIDERHGLALLNGVNTEGTLMAVDYMSDPAKLQQLVAELRKRAPGHSGAWHFQAILHSELRDGVPAGISLVALRTLP